MALWQGGSSRKPTGGRLIRAAGKRRSEIAREHIDTNVGPDKHKIVRTKGANQRIGHPTIPQTSPTIRVS